MIQTYVLTDRSGGILARLVIVVNDCYVTRHRVYAVPWNVIKRVITQCS